MAKTRERITSITVRGFKSICTEQRAEVRPLTLLAGANSSGKSSLMQPILMLKQTLEAAGDPGALLLDGPNVKFTSTEQVLSRISRQTVSTDFAVKVDLDKEALETVFKREQGKGLHIAQMRYCDKKEEVRVTPGMTHAQIQSVLPIQFKSLAEAVEKEGEAKFTWSVYRERCFLAFQLTSAAKPQHRISFGPYGVSPSAEFIPQLKGVIHLPGLRGNPQRNYPKTSGGQGFPGTFEIYAASVVASWQTEKDDRLSELANALERMGLTWKVKAEFVEDTQVELKVGRLPHSRRGGAHDLVNIADVGFGVSQALPVVVALLAAGPGQLVYLEQPEIHLHPKAQRRLADVLKDAISRGVIVVVETHSALLLREVQTLAAKGELATEDVILHWFQRQDDGVTSISTAELDQNGAYGNWPEDFDDTELEAETEYLSAVEGREVTGAQ